MVSYLCCCFVVCVLLGMYRGVFHVIWSDLFLLSFLFRMIFCVTTLSTRLSNKHLEQGYVKERLNSSLRKFYGRYGDLIKQYEVSLSQMLNDILWPDHIQWQPPTDQTLYRTRPFYRIFHRTFATGVACRQGTLTPPDTWSRPFGTCICSTCWDQSFSELVVILPDYALRISLGTFSILLKQWYLRLVQFGIRSHTYCFQI